MCALLGLQSQFSRPGNNPVKVVSGDRQLQVIGRQVSTLQSNALPIKQNSTHLGSVAKHSSIWCRHDGNLRRNDRGEETEAQDHKWGKH